MNSWLGFSLSPQDQLSSPLQTHGAEAVPRLLSSDSVPRSGVEVPRECFDLPPVSSTHSLNIQHLRPDHGHCGILEAFSLSHQPQDWSMKGMEHNIFTINPNLGHQEPKLEDFLGGQSYDYEQKLYECNNGVHDQSFGDSGDYVFSNGSAINGSEEAGASMNGSVGLSMIKTWLRNQPGPQQQESGNNDSNNGGKHNGTETGVALTHTGSLSLSMGTGTQSSSSLPLLAASAASGDGGGQSSVENNMAAGSLDGESGAIETAPRKTVDTFGQRTSIYRGVTRHRWTGRYEAHLWDNSCRREGQTRKGRQVYLGGYDKEEKAARAYDLAALKYWGTTATTNFPISDYEKELEEMKHMTRQEYVASIRRKSSGFSRGASIYRGVTRHHQHGRWQARIGRVAGNKDLYLGTFSTQEEAAEAYDIAAIKFRGLNAVTNFDMSRYDVKSILESSTLPIGGAAKRLKEIEEAETGGDLGTKTVNNYLQLTDGSNSSLAFEEAQPLSVHYPYVPHRGWLQPQQANGAAQSLQDLHHLHLSNTHNFFQPTVFYSGGEGVLGSNGSYQGVGNNCLNITPSTVMSEHSREGHWSFRDNQWNKLGCENMLGVADSYVGRNGYNLSQQSVGIVKRDDDEQSNWMQLSNLPVGHGASVFTVWNEI